jgi:hypothetical protein
MTNLKTKILAVKANADDAAALVMEWANCREAEINDAGDIWISNPQRGHWLSGEDKEKFVSWCEAQ